MTSLGFVSDYERAREVGLEAEALARQLDDRGRLGWVSAALCMACHITDRDPEAEKFGGHGLALGESLDDPLLQVAAGGNLATLFYNSLDPAGAVRMARETAEGVAARWARGPSRGDRPQDCLDAPHARPVVGPAGRLRGRHRPRAGDDPARRRTRGPDYRRDGGDGPRPHLHRARGLRPGSPVAGGEHRPVSRPWLPRLLRGGETASRRGGSRSGRTGEALSLFEGALDTFMDVNPRSFLRVFAWAVSPRPTPTPDTSRKPDASPDRSSTGLANAAKVGGSSSPTTPSGWPPSGRARRNGRWRTAARPGVVARPGIRPAPAGRAVSPRPGRAPPTRRKARAGPRAPLAGRGDVCRDGHALLAGSGEGRARSNLDLS